MTKLELTSLIERTYKTLETACKEPLRNYDDAAKLSSILQKEVLTLTPVIGLLKYDLKNYKMQFSWENERASSMQRDIDNLTIAVNALKSAVSWIDGATIHQTLTSFEALSYPRELVESVLQKDLPKLMSSDFIWSQFQSVKIPKISNEQDLLEYWIPFLHTPTSDEVFLSIFGYKSKGNPDDKLMMRMLEILQKNEHSGLTRAERLEFESNGFTRTNVTDFMQVLEKKYLAESQPDYKQLLMDYYNQLSNNEQVKAHINII